MNDLEEILCTHSVDPHGSGAICAGTPSTLLYEDTSKSPREVHCLDLSGAEPKPAAGKRVIHTELDNITDMCVVQDGDEQVLIVAHMNGVFAYNTETDEPVPKIRYDMEAGGLTTDGRGHLWVIDDGDKSIKTYSVSDGKYLGSLKKDLEEFGPPDKICWLEETSSLLCACRRNGEYELKCLDVQFEDN